MKIRKLSKRHQSLIVFLVIGLSLILFLSGLVSANIAEKVEDLKERIADGYEAGSNFGAINRPVSVNTGWNWVDNTLEGFINFFRFGETWQDVFISIIILIMIFAATYDILLFSAFQTNKVKLILSIGISLIVSAMGVINGITRVLFFIAGGSVAFVTAAAIFLSAFFFIVGSFFRGRIMVANAKQTAKGVEAAHKIIGAGEEGELTRAEKLNRTLGN